MYVDVFTVFVHAIAEPGGSSVGVYKLIQDLEEAMTEKIEIDEEYWILEQTSQGLQQIQTDETNEKHAI
ncbi:antigen B, partial [Methanolobus chelungpuianus]